MLKKILLKKNLPKLQKIKTKKQTLLLKARLTNKSHSVLYKKFLGSLIKKGNKVAAARILHETFLKVTKKTKFPIYRIFNRIFKGLDTYMEVKKVTKRKNTYFIPFGVKHKRNQFLKVKWILDATKDDTRSVKFSDKLYVEVLNLLYRKKKSKVLARKKSIHKDVLKYKANVHYRW